MHFFLAAAGIVSPSPAQRRMPLSSITHLASLIAPSSLLLLSVFFLKKRREKNSSIIPSHAGVPSLHPNTAEAAQGEEGSAVSIVIEGEEDVQEEDSAAKKLEEFFRPPLGLHSAEAEDRRADSEARRTSSPSASGSEVGGERERGKVEGNGGNGGISKILSPFVISFFPLDSVKGPCQPR